MGRTAYVGLGGRTNGAGIQQLADHVRDRGWTVQAVTVERALHLKSAVTALPDETVIGWDPVVDWPGAFPRYEGMPGREGATSSSSARVISSWRPARHGRPSCCVAAAAP